MPRPNDAEGYSPFAARSTAAMSIRFICSIAFHRALCSLRVGIAEQPGERGRHDLPGEAEAVLDPTALLGLGHRREGVGQPDDLGLVLASDLERDRLVELEVRAAVEAGELPSGERELDDQHVARLAARGVRRRAVDAVRADAGTAPLQGQTGSHPPHHGQMSPV
jgi:hypothetical protein